MADIVVVTDDNENETSENNNTASDTDLALTVGTLIGRVENLERRMEELDNNVEEVEAETEMVQNTAETAINLAFDAEGRAAEAEAETRAIAENVVETLVEAEESDVDGDEIAEVFLEPLVIETTTKDATPETAPKSWLDKSWKEWRNKG